MQLLVKTRKATRSEHIIFDHDLYSMNYNKDERNDEDPYKQLSHKNDDFDKIDCKHVPEIFSFLQAYFVLLLMMNQAEVQSKLSRPFIPYPVRPILLSCKVEHSCYDAVAASVTAKSLTNMMNMMNSARAWCKKLGEATYLKLKL